MSGKRESDTSWIYQTDHGSDTESPLGDLIVFLTVLMFVFAVPTGAVKDTGLSIVAGGECEYIEGTIVNKTDDDGFWKIWVVSNVGNMKTTVDQSTYDSVEIGETYSGQVCNGDGALWDLVLWLMANPGEAENISIGELWTISSS